ncbi:MAG: DUF1467 family protein [Pseudomonadota bacterium]
MNWTGGIVVYVILWWCVFLAVLPWRVESLGREAAAEIGAEPGAPREAHLPRKALITSGVAALLWLVAFGVIESGLINPRANPPW